MRKVLVLCTGNSCRSIMAECLINAIGRDKLLAVSAGSAPAGYVHPGAIETLSRHGIMVGETRSKSWDEFEGLSFDLVLTVCDRAASETCPVFAGEYEKLHWSIPDPAGAEGSEEDIRAAFEAAYQMIRQRIESELL